MKFSDEDGKKYDALAVSIKGGKVRMFGENKTLQNARAISTMAAMRRGCDEEYYVEAPAGEYKEGDIYKPKD